MLRVSVAPKIDRNAMVALKLRAGQSIEYDIPVAGEPPPSKTWSFKVDHVQQTFFVNITIPHQHIEAAC